MGKTPKKAAPGGDERNLYIRRLKATNVPSKASDARLPERQRDSENVNRPRVSGAQKQLSSNTGKSSKSKLRSPSKIGPSHLPTQSRTAATSGKAERRLTVFVKDFKTKLPKMQLKSSEETEVQSDVSVQKEDVKNQSSPDKPKKVDEIIINKVEVDENVEKKECAEKGEDLQRDDEKNIEELDNAQDAKSEKESIEPTPEKNENESNGDTVKESTNKDTAKEDDKESSVELSVVIEDSLSKLQEEETKQQDCKEDNKTSETQNVQLESKDTNDEKEDLQSEAQTDTESYSVDIVESTMSEMSETSESVVQIEHDKDKEKSNQIVNDDVSSVPSDSSIILKDVQVKLNDCLKDNSKLVDTSDADHSMSKSLSKDMSFGKTLRNISGRHSISRMRYVTLRDRRLSPNNSLFVNTSALSLPGDEVSDYKMLHHRSGLADTFTCNGTPMERKRKLESEGCNVMKKIRTDSECSSPLNSSIGLLKGLRRPIQVSTPNTAYKFKPDKLNFSGINNSDDKIITEQPEGTRKWCSIM